MWWWAILAPALTLPRLNRAFRALMNGATLVALHRKRHWRSPDGLYLDAGPFVMALEYAANANSIVVGKPSVAYFEMVLNDLEPAAGRVAMIGDDIEIDVKGAKAMGLQGWLVKTGRFRREDLGRGIWPDQTLESIADLIE